MILYVDIDGVITVEPEGLDFLNKTPNYEAIKHLQDLHDVGYQIILWTARWHCEREVTISWLARYNVPYDGLIMQKPLVTAIIDDKSFKSVEEFIKSRNS